MIAGSPEFRGSAEGKGAGTFFSHMETEKGGNWVWRIGFKGGCAIRIGAGKVPDTFSKAQYCDFPPDELMHGERREYSGRYENGAYEYSVVIPDRLVGYDGVNPLYQHGFGIILGKKPYSYIFVDGSPNTLEFTTPADAAKASLKYLSDEAKHVKSQRTTPLQIGGLNAAFLVATYSCPGSTGPLVMAGAFVISPSRRFIYRLTLYATADRYDADRAVLDQIIKSWRNKAQ